MGLFQKDMYKYELFERVKVNFDKEQQKPNVEIEKIFENDDYNFYEYKAANEYSRYLVCQLKENPKLIYFLGDPASLICEFKDNLFLCGGCHEMGSEENLVHRIDLNNKTENFYNFRDYGRMIWCNGYGRWFSTDNYTDMKVEDDELVIYGHREKGDDNDGDNLTNDVFNCEMDFKIVFRFEDNQFVPYFEPIVEEHLKSISKQETKPKQNQTEKNEEEEYKNYMSYLLENSNGIIDLEDAYDFMKVLHAYSTDGKDVALKEFDLLFEKIIGSSDPAMTILKISFLLGVLNSNEIIDVNEMNKLGDKYQNECLNLIMKDKK